MFVKSGTALLLTGSLQIAMQGQSVDLESGFTQVITNKSYVAPTLAELTRAKELFQRTLQDRRNGEELRTNWAALGLEFQEVATAKETLWLLSEPAGKENGRGWYLFRPNHQSSIALEAPHARNDIHTGIIALRLFLDGQARVLAASTITRHRADMARLEDTFFQAFTLAFAAACPTGLVVQLHGFEAGNHRSVQADIIASAGTRSPELWLTELALQLKKATSLPVLAYPNDTKVLGATLNAQGRALQKNGHCRFLHLEMSMELRERLTREDELRRTILDCVSASNRR
jgi:hypothetical protein